MDDLTANVAVRSGVFHARHRSARRLEREAPLVPMAALVVRSTDPVALGQQAVRVRKSGIPDAGNGLFAGSVFGFRDLITEYCGARVSRDEAKAMCVQTHLASLSRHTLVSGLRRAVVGRGGASFANDCRNTSFSYNCELFKSGKLGERLFLKALRRIEDGEELFWNYGRKGFEIAMGNARL